MVIKSYFILKIFKLYNVKKIIDDTFPNAVNF